MKLVLNKCHFTNSSYILDLIAMVDTAEFKTWMSVEYKKSSRSSRCSNNSEAAVSELLEHLEDTSFFVSYINEEWLYTPFESSLPSKGARTDSMTKVE